MLVHIIADYGSGDLAFAEVIQRIKFHLPGAEPIAIPVPSFSTLAAGFCVAQIGLNDPPPGTLIFLNVAPRRDDLEARPENEGERLAYARLSTGVRVIGVNAGYAFSFVRDLSEELRWVGVPAEGSQFRSRDLFPQALGAIVRGELDLLAEPLPRKAIPDLPENRVAYIDGYGNLKTTIAHGAAGPAPGKRLRIRIGGVIRESVAAKASFEVEAGEIAFSPGSSGWNDPKGERIHWMELFLRGGSAWEAFGRPRVGEHVRIIG